MCLNVEVRYNIRAEAREAKPFVATRNIKVYKRLKVHPPGLMSPYRGFLYSPMSYHKAKLNKNITKNDFTHVWHISFHKGLHAYQTFEKCKFKINSSELMVLCIIPKGSTYWKGECEDIVSDQMIVTDQCWARDLGRWMHNQIKGLNMTKTTHQFKKYRISEKQIKDLKTMRLADVYKKAAEALKRRKDFF